MLKNHFLWFTLGRHTRKAGLWMHGLDAWTLDARMLGLWTLALWMPGSLDSGSLDFGPLDPENSIQFW